MSLKGDALAKIAPEALNMLAEITTNIKPKNGVAQFIDENISILSKTKEDEGSDIAYGLLQKLSVAEANKDPEFSLQKLLDFYENFRVWYVNYQSPPELAISKEVGNSESEHITVKGDIEADTMTAEHYQDDATDSE